MRVPEIFVFLANIFQYAVAACIFDKTNSTAFEPIQEHEIISGERLQAFADVVVTTAALAKFHLSFSCSTCHVVYLSEADDDEPIVQLPEQDMYALRSARIIFAYSAILPQVT